jgi:hypothetical protein
LFVQGGQAPAILVDMDANLSEDNNSGGVIDSITIVRNDDYRDVDHTVSSGTSGTPISFVSGQIAEIIVVPAFLLSTGAPFEGQLVLYLYRIGHTHWNVIQQFFTQPVSLLALVTKVQFTLINQP